MKSSFIKITVGIIILAGHTFQVKAQSVEPYTMPNTFRVSLSSEFTGTPYDLFIGLPQNYESSDQSYPVFYIMDGNDGFPLAVTIQRMLKLYGEIPEIIIVGIGYPVDFFNETVSMRWRDLTPSHAPEIDSMYSNRMNVALKSGGADDFLLFLKDQAMPFVEENYRTSEHRSLWGHSLGGLFSAYVMLNEPATFKNYGISSPSLWWNEGEILNETKNFINKNDSIHAKVVLVAGEKENAIIVDFTKEFSELLKKIKSDNFQMHTILFDKENHLSVVPVALTRGLRLFYGEN